MAYLHQQTAIHIKNEFSTSKEQVNIENGWATIPTTPEKAAALIQLLQPKLVIIDMKEYDYCIIKHLHQIISICPSATQIEINKEGFSFCMQFDSKRTLQFGNPTNKPSYSPILSSYC
ncbi:MAG: hypothetical protein R8K22_02615 [Mariprofundaceae bacterium]